MIENGQIKTALIVSGENAATIKQYINELLTNPNIDRKNIRNISPNLTSISGDRHYADP